MDTLRNKSNTQKQFNPKKGYKKRAVKIGVTSFTIVFLSLYLLPLVFGFFTSLKSKETLIDVDSPIIPSTAIEYDYNGMVYPVYDINYMGKIEKAALIEKGADESKYVLIDTPDKKVITKNGQWRLEKRSWRVDFQLSNYKEAAKLINLPLLMLNTFMYAIISTIGMVLSSSLVAYGFARFNFTGKKYLFGVVIATMMLPPAITLIPTYTFFYKIGLVGTWWPLILPTYFANAFNIFLLRQYFMGIPKECDEAAMIDGANYFRIFYSIIIPQALPAFIAVGLFHFFYCWNDYFGPLIYLTGHQDKYPLSVGLFMFQAVHNQRNDHFIQAASIMSLMVPVILFFIFQKYFTRGLSVSSGAEN